EYLRTRKDSTKPWFLFTSYLKPHSPSVEPRRYMEMYDPKAIPVPKLPENISEIRASQPPRGRRRFIEDEQMMRVMSSAYYGAITHVDQQVGRILDELDRDGFADNTLVLFTADHGNMLGDRGRWFKDVMWEGSSHVPLIWRNPKGIVAQPAGTTLTHIVEHGSYAEPACRRDCGRRARPQYPAVTGEAFRCVEEPVFFRITSGHDGDAGMEADRSREGQPGTL
ncbi:MAG: sulfatase-like hydrolase/transferase, partial [Bryobacteraceae bacterium]